MRFMPIFENYLNFYMGPAKFHLSHINGDEICRKMGFNKSISYSFIYERSHNLLIFLTQSSHKLPNSFINKQSFPLINSASSIPIPIQCPIHNISHCIIFPEIVPRNQPISRSSMSLYNFMSDHIIIFSVSCCIQTETVFMEIIFWAWAGTMILVSWFEHLLDWFCAEDSCALFCDTFVSDHCDIVGEMTHWCSKSTLRTKNNPIRPYNIPSQISRWNFSIRIVINLWYPFSITTNITNTKIIRISNCRDIEGRNLSQTNTYMLSDSFSDKDIESYPWYFLNDCSCDSEV